MEKYLKPILCFIFGFIFTSYLLFIVNCTADNSTQNANDTIAKTVCIDRYTTNKDNPMQYIECGTCGAHVLEWWYVRNDADTKSVAVCSKCYDANN